MPEYSRRLLGLRASPDATLSQRCVSEVRFSRTTYAPETVEERELFVPRLAAARGEERRRVMEDLYWVLMNSTEFSWNH